MKTENGKVDGDVTITSELQMTGIFTGHVTVENGGHLILQGVATNKLVAEPGALVEIPGMVTGEVVNNGGKLIITGTISGHLTKISGDTAISPEAVVN